MSEKAEKSLQIGCYIWKFGFGIIPNYDFQYAECGEQI